MSLGVAYNVPGGMCPGGLVSVEGGGGVPVTGLSPYQLHEKEVPGPWVKLSYRKLEIAFK